MCSESVYLACPYCGEPVLAGIRCICTAKAETREPPSINGASLTQKDLDDFLKANPLNKTLRHW